MAHPHKDDLSALLAGLTARMIVGRGHGYVPAAIDQGMTKIADAIAPKIMGAALLKAFDAKDYFARINAKQCLLAIAAMGDGKTTAGKKAELAKAALALQQKTNWLPKEMRVISYAGPGKK